jgi:hypothetical protein
MTSLQLFTLVHTLISCVAIIAGILVVKGMVASAGRQLWTWLFLTSAAAATITGFFFPFEGITPPVVVGAITLVPLTLAMLARYRYRFRGIWRGTYAISVVAALYLIIVALINQKFEYSLPARLATLVAFIVVGFFAVKNFRPKNLLEDIPSTYISPKPETE